MIIISIILISVYQTTNGETDKEKISNYSTNRDIGWAILILSLVAGGSAVVYMVINNSTAVTTHVIQVTNVTGPLSRISQEPSEVSSMYVPTPFLESSDSGLDSERRQIYEWESNRRNDDRLNQIQADRNRALYSDTTWDDLPIR